MQIGIDLGATKTEYVLLDDNNKELERNRAETPKNFPDTVISIVEIISFSLTETLIDPTCEPETPKFSVIPRFNEISVNKESLNSLINSL